MWDKVAVNFSKIGPNYWNWFGKKLVDNSNLKLEQKVLDVGCGRGASLFPASNIVGKKGQAFGIDTSIEMIKCTQEDVDRLDNSNISLSSSNLLEFNYENGQLDYVFCGFGLGYFQANKENYQKVHMLLKDCGEFAVSSWTHQEDQTWLTGLVNKYLEIEVSESKTQKKKQNDMCTEEGVEAILKSENFYDVKTMKVKKTFVFENKEEWWSDLNFTAVKNILDAIKEKGKLELFKEEAFEGLNQYKKNDGIHIKREAVLAYCRTKNKHL